MPSVLLRDSESPIKSSVYGTEFQIDGAENQKAYLEQLVLVNGWTSKQIG